ncbi:MAG: FAD:protein FMN transferase [Nitrosomonadales bacterium]|jgi:thiamine biosynthesis lipoprotein|nr:FAD:protein FMN transferase [Nitrosomonadales bacterium]MBT6251471.1 FAD:protein FMN transferase [Nitrosomonadales bacterium]MBT6602958.1 FAD:protein FMN transferase [Nitrosomonadales bacterium]MBT6817765.1 FAD:protein FMN transferase [Nitrosomonadales bacterium]MBT7120693.1 FAD:protein FMN transferase [Nitrosomonadales bacterium]
MKKHLKLSVLFIVVIIIFSLSECGNKLFQKKDYIFGTIVDIKIYGESKKIASEASDKILSNFNRLHQLLHPWEKSLIFKINKAIKNDSPFLLEDQEVISLIRRGQDYENQTEGFFNPAIGKLVSLWGFHSDIPLKSIPDPKVITKFVEAKPSMNNIKIKNDELNSLNKYVQIDMGAYAKGYALDQAKRILEQYKINNALINIGGNILAMGMHGDREWIVGVQDPRNPNAMATLPLKSGWSIGTSGDYQKYFTLNQQRYSHIIDPYTGYPPTNTQSVTILIPPDENSGEKSDAYTQPLFIVGVQKKIEMAKKLSISHYLIVLENNEILISDELNKIIMWQEKIDDKKITIY